jgi:hypothetical protein
VAGPAAAASAAPLGSAFASSGTTVECTATMDFATVRALIAPRSRPYQPLIETHPVRSAPGFCAPFLATADSLVGKF